MSSRFLVRLLLLFAFYGKFLIVGTRTDPINLQSRVLVPNDVQGLIVTNEFVAGALAIYAFISLLPRRKTQDPRQVAKVPAQTDPSLHVHPVAALAIAAAMNLARLASTSSSILGGAIPGIGAGPLVLVNTYGPLFLAGFLASKATPQTRLAIAVIAVTVGTGIILGQRSAIFLGLLTFLSTVPRASLSLRGREFRGAWTLAVLTIVILASVSLALLVRPTKSTTDTSSPPVAAAEFVFSRVGGFDFLSVALGTPERDQTYSVLDSSRVFQDQLKYSVYGLPDTAKTGVAGTEVAWLFWFGGWLAVVIGGAATALLAVVADNTVRSGLLGPSTLLRNSGGVLQVTTNLFLANLLLEGTPIAALRIAATAVLAVALIAGFQLASSSRHSQAQLVPRRSEHP